MKNKETIKKISQKIDKAKINCDNYILTLKNIETADIINETNRSMDEALPNSLLEQINDIIPSLMSCNAELAKNLIDTIGKKHYNIVFYKELSKTLKKIKDELTK